MTDMTEYGKTARQLDNNQYVNPSIAEALCEIHFSAKYSKFEDSIKELKRLLRDSYHDPHEKTIKNYHATIKEIGISVEEKSISFWVFKHKERNHCIQVFPHMVSINELEKYPGWTAFSQDISLAWDYLQKALSISCIKHIGLRYINLIPRKDAHEPLSQWLQPNRYYPDGILDSVSGFVSRSEFNIEDSRRLIITIAEAMQKNNEKGFIFDIDTTTLINGNIEWDSIFSKIESSHDLIYDVFTTSIARKYEFYLKGEN